MKFEKIFIYMSLIINFILSFNLIIVLKEIYCATFVENSSIKTVLIFESQKLNGYFFISIIFLNIGLIIYFCTVYNKSKELILKGSFIIGAIFFLGLWIVLNEWRVYNFIEWNMSVRNVLVLASVVIFLILLFLYIKNKKEKIKSQELEKEGMKLYKSRENSKIKLETYLNIYNDFSLVGDWGIGKSYLLKNLFKLNDSNYEGIVVDVSSYSVNDKILKKIDFEIDKIFKKNGIFRFKNSIFSEIMTESNIFDKFKNIRLGFFEEDLNDKINELGNKKIVLCLDNIERINDKNRIQQLFSAIDEQFISKIKEKNGLRKNLKVVYVYDEQYISTLFKNENIDFLNYITKYSEAKITLKKIEMSDLENEMEKTGLKKLSDEMNMIKERDIIEYSKQLMEFIRSDILKDKAGISYSKDEENSKMEKNKNLEEDKKITELQKEIIEKFKTKKVEIIKKITNPRFIEQCYREKSRLENEKLKLDSLIKYKVILELFEGISLEDLNEINKYFTGFYYKMTNDGVSNYNLSEKRISLFIIKKLLFLSDDYMEDFNAIEEFSSKKN